MLDPSREYSTLFLSSKVIEEAFSWPHAIEILRQQYGATITDAMFPPRTMARGAGAWLRTLSGVSPDGRYMGAKMIAVNTRSRHGSLLMALFDQASAELVAIVDAHRITGFRTAATTALALDALARPGPVSVGVLGTGFEAQNHVRALSQTRSIVAVSAFSPNPNSRARFEAAMRAEGLNASSAASAQALVESAPDILVCAARSRDESPVFNGEWLSPGMTIASIGSTLPEQREIDPKTIERAALIVADMPEEVAHETGDMDAAKAAGVEFASKLIHLSDLIGGRHVGRRRDDEILLYKSVGSALQDIAVAGMCLDRARGQGLGTLLAETVATVQG